MVKQTGLRLFIKFSFDWIVAFIATIIFLPFVIIPISVLIKLTSKVPILFKQKQVGKDKKLLNLYNFRNMCIDTPSDVPTHLLKNPKQWITPLEKYFLYLQPN